MSTLLAIALLALPTTTPADARTAAVETLVAQANARIAAGEAPAAVETSLTQALSQQGAKVEREPEPWDVYANADWKRNREAFIVTVTPQPIAPDAHEQAPSLLRSDREAASQDHGISGGTRGHAPAPGGAPVVHFPDARRLAAQSPAVVETRLPHARESQPQEGGARLREP